VLSTRQWNTKVHYLWSNSCRLQHYIWYNSFQSFHFWLFYKASIPSACDKRKICETWWYFSFSYVCLL